VSSPKSECTGCRQQRHVGSKTLHQENSLVLNWRCQIKQVDLYNGHKTVVVVVNMINQPDTGGGSVAEWLACWTHVQ